MKTKLFALIIVLASLLAGCNTRSISNFGYKDNQNYSGELSELQVLGVTPDETITNEDIQQAMTNAGQIHLHRGDRVVLVQSGAYFPDDVMMAEAKKYYDIVPLSGVPPRGEKPEYNRYYSDEHRLFESGDSPQLAKSLRLTAAKAGAKTLIVYWGVLETSREVYATKAVSWVPIFGDMVPDEDQETRIRLKAAVIDVATGNWELLTPEVYSDERTTAGVNRENSDQRQVSQLKDQAYTRLVADLQTRYSR